jgi:hypothetical protein
MQTPKLQNPLTSSNASIPSSAGLLGTLQSAGRRIGSDSYGLGRPATLADTLLKSFGLAVPGHAADSDAYSEAQFDRDWGKLQSFVGLPLYNDPSAEQTIREFLQSFGGSQGSKVCDRAVGVIAQVQRYHAAACTTENVIALLYQIHASAADPKSLQLFCNDLLQGRAPQPCGAWRRNALSPSDMQSSMASLMRDFAPAPHTFIPEMSLVIIELAEILAVTATQEDFHGSLENIVSAAHCVATELQKSLSPAHVPASEVSPPSVAAYTHILREMARDHSIEAQLRVKNEIASHPQQYAAPNPTTEFDPSNPYRATLQVPQRLSVALELLQNPTDAQTFKKALQPRKDADATDLQERLAAIDALPATVWNPLAKAVEPLKEQTKQDFCLRLTAVDAPVYLQFIGKICDLETEPDLSKVQKLAVEFQDLAARLQDRQLGSEASSKTAYACALVQNLASVLANQANAKFLVKPPVPSRE